MINNELVFLLCIIGFVLIYGVISSAMLSSMISRESPNEMEEQAEALRKWNEQQERN